MAQKKIVFEKAMTRLEEIVERLESGEASLDETIRLFEEGKQLGQECRRQLTEWEKRIQMIVEKEGGEIEMAELEEAKDEG
jgi:exodeoxyribonuclease VII small subunit